jgi:hypothetical protein
LAVFVIRAFADQYTTHPHLYDPKEIEKSFQLPVRNLISEYCYLEFNNAKDLPFFKDASNIDPFIPVQDTESLEQVISNHLGVGIHRVPVFQSSPKDEMVFVGGQFGGFTGLLSQSDAVSFLYKNISLLGPLVCFLIFLSI